MTHAALNGGADPIIERFIFGQQSRWRGMKQTIRMQGLEASYILLAKREGTLPRPSVKAEVGGLVGQL
jgi:hypothetical protein